METARQFAVILFGFSSGVIISGAVFAFIAIIGIVPRLAQKTKTTDKIKLYEEAIMFGGVLGTVLTFFDVQFSLNKILVGIGSFSSGIFVGCLAMSLAEVLDVIPILTRRAKIQRGMVYFILAIAFGKLFGSLGYYLIPGFFLNE